MTEEISQLDKEAAAAVSLPLNKRIMEWAQQSWRPAGTVLAVSLALLLMWHVVNGQNGLNSWHQKRAADQQLQLEIKHLQDENARLREHVDRLKSDPDAIEHEAREKLHYAKPNEVIVALPTQPNSQPATK